MCTSAFGEVEGRCDAGGSQLVLVRECERRGVLIDGGIAGIVAPSRALNR